MNSRSFPLIGRFRFGWVMFWLLAILLVNALYLGLSDAVRGFEEPWTILFGSAALITGWIMAGSLRKKFIVISASVLIGPFLQMLIYSGSFSDLFRAVIKALETINSFPFTIPPTNETAQILFSLYLMMADIGAFFTDGLNWIRNLFQMQSGFDPKISQVFWGSLFWIAVFFIGWMLRRRRHAFLAVLPASLLLSVVLGYTRRETDGLVLFFGTLLFLMVLQEHLKHETRWDEEKIDYSDEIRFDLAAITVPIIMLIITIAVAIPNISIQDIRDFYNDFVRPESVEQREFSETFGLERVPIEGDPDTARGGMPRSHLIGNVPELSGVLIMEIDTGEVFIPPQANISPPIPKYYWFGRSYDIYNGSGWTTSSIRTETIGIDETIDTLEDSYRQPVIQTVTKTGTASATLYTAGLPASVNQPVRVAWRESTGEYFSANLDADIYQAESLLLELTESVLRLASEPPPAEILDNYMQIPETVPARVLDLAYSVTSAAETPYEKAQAVEAYLRQFPYSLELPEPPVDRDIVDYFLFDLQKGYCDYYASAMVILSRAAGLPARLAVGYATGSYDYAQSLFVVTEANAHAWPEIYIAPFGWVPFEPTAGLSTFNWTVESISPFPLPEMTTGDEPAAFEPPWWLNILGMFLLVLTVLTVGALWYWFLHRQEHTLSTTHQITKLYQKMRTYFEPWMLSQSAALTPREYQHNLISLFQKKSGSSRFKQLFQPMTQEVQILTDAYQQGVYTPRSLSQFQVKKARHSWRNLLWRTIIFRIVFNRDE